MEDKISIIIPVYKVEKYIKKCIDSVINQTYVNLEIILVDDGSPDNCGKICDEYAKKDNRVKVIHKENGGLSDARNYGLDIVEGQFIFFLDSDDFIEKYTIEYLYKLCKKNNAEISVGQTRFLYENQENNKQEEPKENIRIYKTEQALEAMLYSQEFTNIACNKLYKTELFNNIRFPVGRLYEDLATTYKLVSNAKITVLGSKYTYDYLCNRNTSIMHKKFQKKRMEGLDFSEEILEYVRKNYPNIINSAISRLYIESISIFIEIPIKKEYKKERKRVKKYLRKYRSIILTDKKTPIKHKMLCILSIFGKVPLKLMWNMKENLKEKIN